MGKDDRKNVNLSDRQDQILALLIRSYTGDGVPVGSKTLVERFSLSVSSATVRNELSFLDAAGFLEQPHTSGGRVPTEMGYRYFVQRLLGEYELPQSEKQMIQHQFHQARLDISQWMGLATAVLARTSSGASFITYPRSQLNRVKHIQLISTQGRMVLMVLVMVGGEVSQQMLELAESIPQQRLSQAADRLNRLLEGRAGVEIQELVKNIDRILEREVGRLVLDVVSRADRRAISRVHRTGITNLIEDDETRAAVHLLEENSRLANMISSVFEERSSGVRVVIGGDGRWEELKHCTIILSRYGVGEELIGEVAVVGPTRMSYGRNISAVRYVAGLMTEFISDYYADNTLLNSNTYRN